MTFDPAPAARECVVCTQHGQRFGYRLCIDCGFTRGAHSITCEHAKDEQIAELTAHVAALTAVLESAKVLWFNVLFDQGTPRDLHVGWYNEWLVDALDAARGGR